MLAIRFISLCDIQLKLVRANCANPDQRALGRAVWSGFAILGNSVKVETDNLVQALRTRIRPLLKELSDWGLQNL